MQGLFLPKKYIQGSGIIRKCSSYLPIAKGKILLVADLVVQEIVGDAFREAVEAAGLEMSRFLFCGESSEREIERIKSEAQKLGVAAVAGAGGGKAIDAARAASYFMELPMISIPTIAATDAAGSSLVGVYSDNHEYLYPIRTGRNPDIVLADTEILAAAPPRFLVAGMGDALSTKFEAEAVYLAGKTTVHGVLPTQTGVAMATLAYDIVTELGYMAKLSACVGRTTHAFEKVVEANLFLSGAGAENGGVAAAHGLHTGLTAIPDTRHVYHGEKVAFGTVVQLILENKPLALISALQKFLVQVGLPVTLAQLGIKEDVSAKLESVVSKACQKGSYVHSMPFVVTEDSLYSALLIADELGREMLLKSQSMEKCGDCV